jgi:hypothetical protein
MVAVGMVKCAVSSSFGACQAAYFAGHPERMDPVGLAFNLYDCAVCSQCAQPCANAHDFDLFCNCRGQPGCVHPGCQ